MRMEGKEVNKMLVILLAEQVLSGKIKIEQIGNGFNLRKRVEAKIKEMLNEQEEEAGSKPLLLSYLQRR